MKKVDFTLKLIVRFLKLFTYPIFFLRVKKRSSLAFTDIFRLTKEIKSNPFVLDDMNTMYGHYRIVKSPMFRSNYKHIHNYVIEHGLHLGDNFEFRYLKYRPKTIITFSEQRAKKITEKLKKLDYKKNVKVISIGPYINYFQGMLSVNKIQQIKAKFQKTLLVFPFHSTPTENSNLHKTMNTSLKTIKHIKEYYSDFNTIMVCSYYNDILLGNHKLYKDEGYIVVTAGHRRDPYFLDRLRDIISLADMSISNAVGTHIGYCISMNVPHQIVKDTSVDVDEIDTLYDSDIKYIENFFFGRQVIITKEQRKVIADYFGT